MLDEAWYQNPAPFDLTTDKTKYFVGTLAERIDAMTISPRMSFWDDDGNLKPDPVDAEIEAYSKLQFDVLNGRQAVSVIEDFGFRKLGRDEAYFAAGYEDDFREKPESKMFDYVTDESNRIDSAMRYFNITGMSLHSTKSGAKVYRLDFGPNYVKNLEEFGGIDGNSELKSTYVNLELGDKILKSALCNDRFAGLEPAKWNEDDDFYVDRIINDLHMRDDAPETNVLRVLKLAEERSRGIYGKNLTPDLFVLNYDLVDFDDDDLFDDLFDDDYGDYLDNSIEERLTGYDAPQIVGLKGVEVSTPDGMVVDLATVDFDAKITMEDKKEQEFRKSFGKIKDTIEIGTEIIDNFERDPSIVYDLYQQPEQVAPVTTVSQKWGDNLLEL